MSRKYDIAIAGAGVVGVSTALWAQMRGMDVVLVDPNEPGSGASYGNAGTIATYACVPLNSPGIIKNLPNLLFSKESPLGFDWIYALTHPRWMLSFLRHCTPNKVARISAALGDILSHADAGLNPLIKEAGAEDLMVSNDCLYIYSSKSGFNAAQADIATRRANGVDLAVLSADEIRDLEPNVVMPIHQGLIYKGARHVKDPQELVLRMHRKFIANGGKWIRASVDSCEAAEKIKLSDGQVLSANKIVIATGAHAKSIEGAGTENLPLDTERGHHIMYKDHGELISRPVGWADAGFYAIPMQAGLRIAGTVEIAGLKKPKSAGRIAYLTRKSHEMFGDLGQPNDDWLGFRPTMPDSLPMIGKAKVSDNILYAFGHQHIGLTLAGITGRTITEMAENKRPNFDVSAFDPNRFK